MNGWRSDFMHSVSHLPNYSWKSLKWWLCSRNFTSTKMACKQSSPLLSLAIPILFISLAARSLAAPQAGVRHPETGSEHDSIVPETHAPINPYVLGGSNASAGEFPWHVSLQYVHGGANYHLCSGSIISLNYVLTTGLCVAYLQATPYTVRAVAGRLDLYTPEPAEQNIPVEKIIINPSFKVANNPYSVTADIALIKLATSLTITPSVKIVALPPQGHNPPEGISRLVGYGPSGGALQKANVAKIDNTLCQVWLGSGYSINTSQICAVGDDDTIAATTGDEGSGLVHSNHLFLNGLFSYGSSASTRENAPGIRPAVFTKVSAYSTWIAANAK